MNTDSLAKAAGIPVLILHGPADCVTSVPKGAHCSLLDSISDDKRLRIGDLTTGAIKKK
jgi:hypothetical protein